MQLFLHESREQVQKITGRIFHRNRQETLESIPKRLTRVVSCQIKKKEFEDESQSNFHEKYILNGIS